MKYHLLFASMDAPAQSKLSDDLIADDFVVTPVRGSEKAIEALQGPSRSSYDAVLADVNGATRALIDEAAKTRIPVVAMTDYSDEEWFLTYERWMRAGADAVLSKPLVYREFRWLMLAIARRGRLTNHNILSEGVSLEEGTIEVGPIAIEPRSRRVSVRGTEVRLTAKEYRLLLRLASDPLRVFTKQELIRDLWGGLDMGTRSLDTHACRLRKQIREAGADAIVNQWGVGYRLFDPAYEEAGQEPAAA